MAQINKAGGQVEIKCNADKFFDVWVRNTTQVSKMCPNKFPYIELLEGDNCHTLGAILRWTFVSPVDGKHQYMKTVLAEIDENKKTFSYKLIGGDTMEKYYKTWKDKVEVIPKDENCSIVKWSVIEFESKSEDAPDPMVFINFLLGCIKDTGRHVSSAYSLNES